MIVIQSFCQRAAWLFTFIYTRFFGLFKVVGQENLKNLKLPLLIVANHRSLWDPLIVGTLFPLFSPKIPLGFMVADVYYNNIFLRPLFWLTRTYPARKGEGMDISLKGPRKVLKNGGVFLIFPLGKRHFAGRPPRPRRGAAVLAMETPRLTILPVYLQSLREVIVGQPFKLAERTHSLDSSKVADIIAETIFKLAA